MRLLKENINMNCMVGNTATQIYINEEVTVSEANQPVSYVIKECGNAVVNSIKIRDDQINMTGTLEYSVLYGTDNSDMAQGIQGEISFDDVIRMSGIRENDEAHIRINVDNLSVRVIGPRKLLVKAELTAYTIAEERVDQEIAVNVMEEDVSVLRKNIETLSLVADRTETLRIKEDITIPGGKPGIYRIIWKDIKIRNVATRLLEGALHISGEIDGFIMYIPDDDNTSHQWYETIIPFTETVELSDVNEEMIAYACAEIQNVSLELNNSELGEARSIFANILLRIDLKIYEEKKMEIIEDVYAPYTNLVPIIKPGMYQKLLVKNSSKCKNVFRLKGDLSKGNILQICNSGVDVKIENIAPCEDGIDVSGKIKAFVIYVSSNDREPLCCMSREMDFSHKIDVEGISKTDEYYMNKRVEQVTANMVSADEIELKVEILMEAIVFKNCQQNMVVDVEESEIDSEKFSRIPTLKGHVVQNGETLWKLAKENYTTVDKIMEINNLKSDNIKVGDRLLLMKVVAK